jgi:transglutaminase-like putative cysteine protease
MTKNKFKSNSNIASRLLSLLLVLIFAITTLPVLPAYAQSDFEINIQRQFTVGADKKALHITETRTIKNNSNSYYIPRATEETFIIQNFKEGFDQQEKQIKLDSISVKDKNGSRLSFTKEIINEDIEITVEYPSALWAGEELTFILEYETNELIEQIGRVTNIYIPGLEDDYQRVSQNDDGSITQEITYQTKLEIPTEFETNAFTVPSPNKTYQEGENTILEFSTDSILGKSVWHQIGDNQIYSFKITQPTMKTDKLTPDQLAFLSKNQYTIVLPREYNETNQKVFYTNIDPKPATVKRDKDGNLIASFMVDANKKTEIVVEGYITVSMENLGEDDRNGLPSSTDLSQIQKHSDMERYLKESEYWQVNHPKIQAKSEKLVGNETDILKILEADYKFIVESIDYDDFKYGDRNKRQGALATLEGGDSVCMEYSDLLITLLRAQGIPARAAYGYGYDPQFEPSNQESHQWVQAWVPEYGWLTIDPTWGETGRKFIGKDLDHALWYVASQHPDEPAPLEVTSSFSDFEIAQSVIEIIAVEELPDSNKFITVQELENTYPQEQQRIAEISEKIQISPVGKSLVIIAPSCLIIVVIIILVQSLVKLFKTNSKTPEIY